MKKLIIFSVMLAVLVALMAGAVCAAPVVLTTSGSLISGGGEHWTSSLPIGAGIWNFKCSGGTTLTATTDNATLSAAWSDSSTAIWKFQVSNDDSSWTDIIFGAGSTVPPEVLGVNGLVHGSSALVDDTVVGSQKGTALGVSAKYIRIGYDVNVVGANAVAAGTAGITATAVPEPSSLVALATGVVGIVGLLRRRRS